ncbi:MAG: hypothetical protein ABSD71_15030 [Bacteroidales bacterium]|jgi:hypothetical protein
MAKEIKIIDCTSQLINPVLIRMNCLALAVSDETLASPLKWAKIYYNWIINEERSDPDLKDKVKEENV